MSESIFDDNGNLSVPLEMVLENLMQKNAQLSMEIATLQSGNQMLQSKVRELMQELENK